MNTCTAIQAALLVIAAIASTPAASEHLLPNAAEMPTGDVWPSHVGQTSAPSRATVQQRRMSSTHLREVRSRLRERGHRRGKSSLILPLQCNVRTPRLERAARVAPQGKCNPEHAALQKCTADEILTAPHRKIHWLRVALLFGIRGPS
jgi:hypothetical protein